MGLRDAVVRQQTRPGLIPRGFTVAVLGLLSVVLVASLGMSLVEDGVLGWSFRAGLVFSGLLLVSAVSALVRPRRRREPVVAADGTRTFVAPAATVYPLVLAVVAMWLTGALWGYVALTDFGSLESPGFALVAIGGTVATVPDLVRLITGRLHRWRLDIGPETVRYRGYRTDVTYPWSKVHGASIQARGPAGVVIDVKGGGQDPVVPIAAFVVPAEQLVEEIQHTKAAARR